jgi:hypothetical protein
MRRSAKVDSNQACIVKSLRDIGVSVKVVSETKAFCDIVAGYRGCNILIEIKNLEGKGKKLTTDEQAFHDSWAGQIAVVTNAEEAQLAVIEHARRCGRL